MIALALVLVSLGAGDHDRSLAFGGATRTYFVHVPPRVSEGQPLPVVLAFHGGGGNASGFKAYAGLDALADRQGFVVVYPDGSGRLGRRLLTWNAGGCCGYAAAQNVDDVGFALAVLRDVARNVSVDPARVYATGHSNGAMMAYRMAIDASDRIAAVAPVAGAMQAPGFPPPRPVPVLHIHSVDDPRALYAGGLGPRRFRARRAASPIVPSSRSSRSGSRTTVCPSEPRTVEQRTTPSRGRTRSHGDPPRVGTVCRRRGSAALEADRRGPRLAGRARAAPREGHGTGNRHDRRGPGSLAVRVPLPSTGRARASKPAEHRILAGLRGPVIRSLQCALQARRGAGAPPAEARS